MKQVSKRKMLKFLQEYEYKPIRTKGSHTIYSNGEYTISVPMVTLKAVVANRLIKEIKEKRQFPIDI